MNAVLRLRRRLESFLALWAIQLLVGYDLRPLVDEVKDLARSLDEVPCPRCGGIGEHHFVMDDHEPSLREEMYLS